MSRRLILHDQPNLGGPNRRTDRHVNEYGAGIIRTRSETVCDGCGRTIPYGSHVIRWNCWDRGRKVRVRFCRDCERVIYECESHGRVYVYHDDVDKKLLVAKMCRSCDRYLSCPMSEFLRTMGPDDIWWGGLDARRQ